LIADPFPSSRQAKGSGVDFSVTRTLVLCIDRDDDLGKKAGIRGPVVGRKEVLTAALRLGIADPEESDTNAMLGALHLHDQLKESAESNDAVEIAVLTGDERVGVRSDRAVSQQLEEVIEKFQPDRGMLVTDGAEDESILPLIQSRLHIDHVQKIIVRQSKGIEGTYYYIVKAIEDPKWRARLLVPLSVFLILIGLGMILPNGGVIIGLMPLLIGIYLMAKGLGAEQHLNSIMRDMRENADAAFVSSILWAGTVFCAVVSLAEGIRVYRSQMSETPTPGGLEIILLVLQGSLTWIVLAFLTLALSLLVLKMNRGTFSGRTLEVIALGIFIWTFGGAALGMALKVLDSTYSLEPAILWEDWDRVLGALVLLWAVRQAVRSINERDKPTGKYWGI
jgi:putative membrane protein